MTKRLMLCQCPCPRHIGCLCIQLSEDEEVQGAYIDLLQPHVLVAPPRTAELCRELVLMSWCMVVSFCMTGKMRNGRGAGTPEGG